MDTTQKAVWLHGYQDAVQICATVAYSLEPKSTDLPKKILDLQLDSRLTAFEWAEGIDSFYQDATNLPIPIAAALRYVRLKSDGASQSELDDLAASLRKANSNKQ